MYELSGELEEGRAYWLIYPLKQDYNALMKDMVFPAKWRNMGSPMPRTTTPLLLSAIICLFSSLLIKSWMKRAVGLTISIVLLLLCVGDFTQDFMHLLIKNDLPIPPGELNFQEYAISAKWGAGIYIAGLAAIFLGFAIGLELLKITILMGKEATNKLHIRAA